MSAPRFIDLHIHSKFSRATSPALDPLTLAQWAGYKGLSLLGTGDLTHPGWLAELNGHLTRRDDGFYSLKDQPHGVRFVPTGEVSAIYKQDGRTRKIHLVVLAPDLEKAAVFSAALGARGNVEADGRPILGLTARQILEIALTVSPEMAVVPAHIWTPWFSLFGAQSGFDRLEECFGDLSGHITALETGLSSDPDMNRLVSPLDPYSLVSSSDAHSPDKLGREATLLDGPLTWDTLKAALAGGSALAGTVEFFPEEGKYHLDGHTACGPALSPEETRNLKGLCPVCGRKLTIGVLHRVMELADRSSPRRESDRPDVHLVPLAEMLGQALGVGPRSGKVTEQYLRLVQALGGELPLLVNASLEEIGEQGGPLLRLAVEKMRQGQVLAEGGYDGQYGRILVLTEEEKAAFSGQGRLFETGGSVPAPRRRKAPAQSGLRPVEAVPLLVNSGPHFLVQGDPLLDVLDEEQRRVVTSPSRVLSILAGPGSGKTRVLVHRAAWLLREGLVAPEKLLLTTYTNKAADSLAARLKAALPFRTDGDRISVGTLHGLAYRLLKNQRPDWALADSEVLESLAKKASGRFGLKAKDLVSQLTVWKNSPSSLWASSRPSDLEKAASYYQAALTERRLWDFDDLILKADPATLQMKRPFFQAVLVDEFQDFSAAQFDFLTRLLPPASDGGLTVIGDPDQSIYGFRGARRDIYERLQVYPKLETLRLGANYRSSRTIVEAGTALLGEDRRPPRTPLGLGPRITRASLASGPGEAVWVADRIQAHLGVLSLGREGGGRGDHEVMAGLGLNDIAVLFRLKSLAWELGRILDERGLPWQISGEDPLTAVDGLDFTADKINLLTMHAAKGLEFRLVFIIGLEEGLCPYLPEGDDQERELEEARLLYVALTRAQERLYLSRSRLRRLYGQPLSGRPSPLWPRIPENLCLDLSPDARRRRFPKPQPTLFG